MLGGDWLIFGMEMGFERGVGSPRIGVRGRLRRLPRSRGKPGPMAAPLDSDFRRNDGEF